MNEEQLANLLNLLGEHGGPLLDEMARRYFIEGSIDAVCSVLFAVAAAWIYKLRKKEPGLFWVLVFGLSFCSLLVLHEAVPKLLAPRGVALMEMLK